MILLELPEDRPGSPDPGRRLQSPRLPRPFRARRRRPGVSFITCHTSIDHACLSFLRIRRSRIPMSACHRASRRDEVELGASRQLRLSAIGTHECDRAGDLLVHPGQRAHSATAETSLYAASASAAIQRRDRLGTKVPSRSISLRASLHMRVGRTVRPGSAGRRGLEDAMTS